jgi:hypothetical protein
MSSSTSSSSPPSSCSGEVFCEYQDFGRLVKEANLTIDRFQKYMRYGPWQLEADSFSVFESLWQNLWARAVAEKSATAVAFLRKVEHVYSQDICQKRAIPSKSLAHFITNCELAYRELNETTTTTIRQERKNFISNCHLANLVAYDGFTPFPDVDVSPLATQFSSSLINQQIRNMYSFLSTKQIDNLPSCYVNAALCQLLLDSVDSAVSTTKKAITRRDEIKIHVPFWCNYHKFDDILRSDLLTQLTDVFQKHDNFYALHKETEIWKERTASKLKRFYQKNNA